MLEMSQSSCDTVLSGLVMALGRVASYDSLQGVYPLI